MTLPEPEGRPIWEPVIIALFLALLVAYDGQELLALIQGRMPVTGQVRAVLELGAAAMMVLGVMAGILRAVRWTPED
jgi:hypothetical protein